MAAGGALALLLTAVGTAPAQVVFFPAGFGGTGAVFGPRGGFYYPGYNPSYYQSYGGGRPYGYYSQPSYSSYSITYTTTPMYYGSASLGYGGGSTTRIVSPSPDVSYRQATGVSAAAYENQGYPIQSPNYTATYPVSPPISVVAAMTEKRTETSAAAPPVQVPVYPPCCAPPGR